MISKIVSGGQTGADRAGLDIAIKLGIPYGGWCPKGKLDELGTIPAKYDQLKEIEGNFTNQQENYDTRTKLNIRDSDGTLILLPKIPIPSNIKDGTLLTIREVSGQRKPYLLLDMSVNPDENAMKLQEWLFSNSISILNIAGPRESSVNGIYESCYKFLLNSIKPPEEKLLCKL